MESKQQQKPTGPKMVRAKVISNYGTKRPGEWVEISEADYINIGKTVSHPVLATQADLDAVEAKAKAEEADRAAQMKITDEGARADGWHKKQQESLRIVQAQRIEEQRRQQAILTGEGMPEQNREEVAAEARRRLAGSRAG